MAARLPSLLALRAFEAAARHQNFGRAGDELHVTHSAISRQVRALEDDLGRVLFERRNRAVFLTEEGKKLLNSTRAAFHQIAECCAELRVGIAAPLVISCEPTLTQRWLIPRLPSFVSACPEIVMHILAAGGVVNFEKQHVDAAIRRSDFAWPSDVFAETIVEELVGPVCAPAVARGKRLDEILKLPRIHSATRPDAWERWLVDNKIRAAFTPGRTFEHFYLSIEAAVAGLGIAIGPQLLVTAAVRSGQLVTPWGFGSNGFRYVLLSRTPVNSDHRKLALLEWLKKQIASSLLLPTAQRKTRRRRKR